MQESLWLGELGNQVLQPWEDFPICVFGLAHNFANRECLIEDSQMCPPWHFSGESSENRFSSAPRLHRAAHEGAPAPRCTEWVPGFRSSPQALSCCQLAQADPLCCSSLAAIAPHMARFNRGPDQHGYRGCQIPRETEATVVRYC